LHARAGSDHGGAVVTQLASALERIATEQEIAAINLAAVWFVD
jgi:hypothetical protein